MATDREIENLTLGIRALIGQCEQAQRAWLCQLACPLPAALADDSERLLYPLRALTEFEPFADLDVHETSRPGALSKRNYARAHSHTEKPVKSSGDTRRAKPSLNPGLVQSKPVARLRPGTPSAAHRGIEQEPHTSRSSSDFTEKSTGFTTPDGETLNKDIGGAYSRRSAEPRAYGNSPTEKARWTNTVPHSKTRHFNQTQQSILASNTRKLDIQPLILEEQHRTAVEQDSELTASTPIEAAEPHPVGFALLAEITRERKEPEVPSTSRQFFSSQNPDVKQLLPSVASQPNNSAHGRTAIQRTSAEPRREIWRGQKNNQTANVTDSLEQRLRDAAYLHGIDLT